MKVKTLTDGHDGTRAYEAGALLEGTEHARALLASGMAEPADKEAETLAVDKSFLARHHRPALAAAAAGFRASGARAAKAKK